MWGDISISFLLAFVAAFVITPYTIRLAKRVGAIDLPEKRRVNEEPMPRLGRYCSYYRFFTFNYIFNNCNVNGRLIKFIWR